MATPSCLAAAAPIHTATPESTVRATLAAGVVRSSAGDAQGQLRWAAALHQPRDLVPVEVVGVDLGQRPGDAEPGEPCYAPVVHERLFIVDAWRPCGRSAAPRRGRS